jgi:hypothetical protein
VDPYTALESAARERLARRKFELVRLSPEERNDLGAEDDVASLELLRGLGARAGARLALGISSHYATFESEHSHNGEQKLVVSATLVDVKTGAQLGHSSTNVSEPHGRRDQYAVELKKELAEEGKDLFHEIFVSAGKRLARATGLENFSVVRVNQPGSAQLMSQFRSFLESIKGVGSVTEQGASRGYFDFALRPVQKAPALAKAIKAASPDDIVVDVVNTEAVENSGGPLLAVTVAPKEVAPPAGEVQSEHP